MVVQRHMEVPVFGWADPGEKVTVSFAGQEKSVTADAEGNWQVKLDPLEANSTPQTMTISASNQVLVEDVLVGEVWICSGQSNMQWPVTATWNADLTIASAKRPTIRLLTVENAGVQKPIQDFEGAWQVCSPETVADFSAVGYHFAEQLQAILGVPIGLIDNAWGGSSAEAWVQREHLAADEANYGPLMQRWQETEAAYETALLYWQQSQIAAKQAGKEIPRQPDRPNNQMVNQHRPGNLFQGRVEPIMPFAIRGVIWYQGESNASRAYQYRHLFPLLIQNWREAWGQDEFPFYWVQLADFKDEATGPTESDWAELREAQTMTLDALPNTGQAVIIDIGEADDIHPRNKLEVGKRLARLALKNDYGMELPAESPRYKSLEIQDSKAVVTFDTSAGKLRTVDDRNLHGFAIAGEDKKWVPAQAKLDGENRVIVWSDEVSSPVAVRYAWADNPVCNLYSEAGLPVTPFRTDDWAGVTANNR
jgi:sialate O-acetylesterase